VAEASSELRSIEREQAPLYGVATIEIAEHNCHAAAVKGPETKANGALKTAIAHSSLAIQKITLNRNPYSISDRRER